MSIRIIIKTEPVAKGRPRVAFRNGGVRTYTPSRTVEAQNLIVERVMRYKDRCFAQHIPVKLTATFYRTKSKWLPQKESMPFRKPDLDNLGKLLSDSINGILVADDAQITNLHLRKRWASDNNGRITIKLEEDRDGDHI